MKDNKTILDDEFYEDESGAGGYWDFAFLIANELGNVELQEKIYNLLKYDYNDQLKDLVKLKVDKDGCIHE